MTECHCPQNLNVQQHHHENYGDFRVTSTGMVVIVKYIKIIQLVKKLKQGHTDSAVH
jgi:hypothetical protein